MLLEKKSINTKCTLKINEYIHILWNSKDKMTELEKVQLLENRRGKINIRSYGRMVNLKKKILKQTYN